MSELFSPMPPEAGLVSLASALSDYVRRYGATDRERFAVTSLEEALSDYILRYGLTDQARAAMRASPETIGIPSLVYEANLATSGP